MSDQPIKRFRIGAISAAIWRNTTKDEKVWYATTILRTYRTGDGWRETASFNARDLPVIAKLTDIASRYILALEAETASSDERRAAA